MEITETERVYCFGITERQFQIVMEKDDRAIELYDSIAGKYRFPDRLINRICGIRGVREVNFDPMFGPYIHVRIESETLSETLVKVKDMIARYVR